MKGPMGLVGTKSLRLGPNEQGSCPRGVLSKGGRGLAQGMSRPWPDLSGGQLKLGCPTSPRRTMNGARSPLCKSSSNVSVVPLQRFSSPNRTALGPSRIRVSSFRHAPIVAHSPRICRRRLWSLSGPRTLYRTLFDALFSGILCTPPISGASPP